MDPHPPAGEWHGDAPGADGELEGTAVPGQLGEDVDDGVHEGRFEHAADAAS